MFKRKFLYINILLLVCVSFLGILFRQSIREEDLELGKNAADIVLQEKIKSKKALKRNFKDWTYLFNSDKVSLEKYSSVSERNLFRPERKEWVPPPPPPPPKIPESSEDKDDELVDEKPKEPDLPDPYLYGIVMAGKDKRMAIMRGYEKPEEKPRFREVTISGAKKKIPLPSRPSKPLLSKKTTVYEVGEYVSGSKIIAIKKGLVRLKRDAGEEFVVKLFDPDVKKPAVAGSRQRRNSIKAVGRKWSSRSRVPLRRAPNKSGRSPGATNERVYNRSYNRSRNNRSAGGIGRTGRGAGSISGR